MTRAEIEAILAGTSGVTPGPWTLRWLATALLESMDRVEEAREAVLNLKTKQRLAFRKALAELPEIAPPEVQSVLSSVHMQEEFMQEGKRLQHEFGTDAVPPRVEQECGAGAWSFMRQGVLAARKSLGGCNG